MSRDFLVKFKNNIEAQEAEKKLENVYITKDPKNKFFLIDRKKNTLFVTLAYPNSINRDTIVIINEKKINLYKHVSLVAIKNAEHSQIGYAYYEIH